MIKLIAGKLTFPLFSFSLNGSNTYVSVVLYLMSLTWMKPRFRDDPGQARNVDLLHELNWLDDMYSLPNAPVHIPVCR